MPALYLRSLMSKSGEAARKQNEVGICVNCEYEQRQRERAEVHIKDLQGQIGDVIRYKDSLIAVAEDEARKYKGTLESFKNFLVDLEEMK